LPESRAIGRELESVLRRFMDDKGVCMASPTETMTGRRDSTAPELRPVLSEVEARQGVTRHNVRYVLGFGLGAVIVAFAVLYFIYFA
jgi:hypothetical protein